MASPHVCPRCRGEWGYITWCLVCKGKGLVWEQENTREFDPYPVPYGIPYVVPDKLADVCNSPHEIEYKRLYGMNYKRRR